MSNPLLGQTGLPLFNDIRPEHVEPAIDTILKENRARIAQVYDNPDRISWDTVIAPMEDMEDRLHRAWSPVSHMNSVVNTDPLREAYNACLPKLSDYATEVGQNVNIFKAYRALKESAEYNTLSVAQKKVIDNALRDFHLSGVDLPADKKDRYKAIRQELSQLGAKFEENVLDATHAWTRHVTDETMLAGLPQSARAMAAQAAKDRELTGWVFTLEFPSYYAAITHADNAELRREIYEAYVTRASGTGPGDGQWDNSEVMEKLLALRHELAGLLGFDSYSHYSLATKMASDPQQVLHFLHDLAARSRPMAQRELDQLREFARERLDMAELQPWDIAWASEKQKHHLFDFTQEELKPYFAEQGVLDGLFSIVKRLYGLDIRREPEVSAWHKDVRLYNIFDADGDLRGRFYLDLYARQKKRGGAWMDDCQSRRITDSGIQTPVAYLVCNLSPPAGDEPAQFTHDEVVTLFHEFGHGLHHMLTRIDCLDVSGINGVAWDAVELPSQFMENWCWEREALDLMARHYQTGETLPDALYQKMIAARNYGSGMQMVRQLEFSLFDFRLHLEYDPNQGGRIQDILNQVREEVAVIKPPAFNRFQHSFSHIFAGGYAAGYYSYKWAEVLSADAFSLFEETGIFNQDTGRRFMHGILEQGGSRDAMDLFVEFRGREPDIEPLLRHNGITA